jgi:hypothetical protein
VINGQEPKATKLRNTLADPNLTYETLDALVAEFIEYDILHCMHLKVISKEVISSYIPILGWPKQAHITKMDGQKLLTGSRRSQFPR